MKSITKSLILTAAVAALLGGVAYQAFFAAEDERGHAHAHAHEEGEKTHKEGANEHGHAHSEPKKDDGHGHGEEDEHGHGEEGYDGGILKLSPEQMEASGIKTIAIRKGSLSHQVTVPGRIVADADRMAQIVPKASGIVIEVKKNLGDTVMKGEVLALIESREMAEAAAEYQAAQRSAELARTTHNREKSLWEKKITAEQDYLTAKNAWQEAQIRLDLAKQRMQTLGGAGQNGKPSRYHELKSPLGGLVVERELTLGEFVDTSHKAFIVADLSVLWVEIAIAPDDLPKVKEGQNAIIEGSGKQGQGKLIFVSPVINPSTRSAKAIVELDNADGLWRSGDYANTSIITGTQAASVIVPQEAVQTIEGKSVVFVKTAEGFEKRDITLGKKDGQSLEVSVGLSADEVVAIGNTFVLKAEAGKSEAEHSH